MGLRPRVYRYFFQAGIFFIFAFKISHLCENAKLISNTVKSMLQYNNNNITIAQKC